MGTRHFANFHKIKVEAMSRKNARPRMIDQFDRREMIDSLRRLGFRSYTEYRNSPLWKRIRARVLTRDNGLCKRCGRKAWQVHHTNYAYETLAGLRDEHLQSACGGCHEQSHNRGEARPLTPPRKKNPAKKKRERPA